MIVVDASVVVTALVGEAEFGDAARARLLADTDLHVPHVIDLEIASALRRNVRSRAMSSRRAAQAIEDLGDLRLHRYPHAPFLARTWELRENITTYDAVYVALAEALETVFVTADERLARTPGMRCACEVLSA